ncbi:carbohydrate ABC transporter permease [Paenibacillus sp. HB172176]|uniref:carbohydrate ABC transporter permease n=1 Tax=Paenibacillus sp. HB172176 TaxID=2493690 RepID=UPI0014392B49|nr:carbohydrate ABC transporter permease [Paenibacillus sp. HB172176]
MRDSLADKILINVNSILLILFAASCILPLIHLFALSFSEQSAIFSGKVGLWPVGFTSQAYDKLLDGTRIISALKNSIVITLVGVILNLIFTIICAYPLSRGYMYGRRFFTLAIVFTMLFSGGLIPGYLLVKSLGLIDTYGAIWLPGLVSVYNMLVMRTFFTNIPEELVESARMDGGGEWTILWRIFLPLSIPVIVALGLFYGVGHWNSFFNMLIFINSADKQNLAVMVQQMIQSQSILQEIGNLSPEDFKSITPESIKSAGIIVMIIPMLIVYPFLQKYFIKGMLIGAIKG